MRVDLQSIPLALAALSVTEDSRVGQANCQSNARCSLRSAHLAKAALANQRAQRQLLVQDHVHARRRLAAAKGAAALARGRKRPARRRRWLHTIRRIARSSRALAIAEAQIVVRCCAAANDSIGVCWYLQCNASVSPLR